MITQTHISCFISLPKLETRLGISPALIIFVHITTSTPPSPNCSHLYKPCATSHPHSSQATASPSDLMAFLIALSLSVFLNLLSINAQPSPGYYPSSSMSPIRFTDGYTNLWGPEHQTISPDQYSTTIWLDSKSGLFE